MAHSQITVPIAVIVVGSGALHATWNAIAKHLDDRLIAFALIGIASTLGGGAVLALTGLPYRASIGFAVASAAIHVGYELALMNSFRLGAFNQVYPIARGTSPLVVAIGAYVLAGERLGVVPLAGVAILGAGLVSLALSSGRLTGSELPAAAAAVLTGLAIAGYTIVDGLGVRRSHDPYAYAGLLACHEVGPERDEQRRRPAGDRVDLVERAEPVRVHQGQLVADVDRRGGRGETDRRTIRQAGERQDDAAAKRRGHPDQGERDQPVVEVLRDRVPGRVQRARADHGGDDRNGDLGMRHSGSFCLSRFRACQ